MNQHSISLDLNWPLDGDAYVPQNFIPSRIVQGPFGTVQFVDFKAPGGNLIDCVWLKIGPQQGPYRFDQLTKLDDFLEHRGVGPIHKHGALRASDGIFVTVSARRGVLEKVLTPA